MASLAEKLRACIALDGKAAAFVYVEAGRCLALDAEDLESIADALEEYDETYTADDADALRAKLGAAYEAIDDANEEIEKLKAKLEGRLEGVEPVAYLVTYINGNSWVSRGVGAESISAVDKAVSNGAEASPLYRHPPKAPTFSRAKKGDQCPVPPPSSAELDAAKAEIAALKAKLEESVGVAQAVAWGAQTTRGLVPFATKSEAEAEFSFSTVLPLYLRPPAAEALPTREDLEVVLRETARLGDVPLGDAFALAEDDGVFCVYDPKQEAEGLTFAEAVTEAAAILRAKKAEG